MSYINKHKGVYMSSVVQNILDTVVGDGARSSKFECYVVFDNVLFNKQNDIVHLVKTSQFPGKRHESIDMRFKGRTIPIKGQVKYDNTWTCTFYLTQDHELKTAIENWIESIDQVHNVKDLSGTVVEAAQINNGRNGYTSRMYIKQMDFHGYQDTVSYELINVFPRSVSAVEVDYSTVGTILEFSVEFSYSHYNTYNEKTANGSFVDDKVKETQKAINAVSNEVKGNIAETVAKFKSRFKEIKPNKSILPSFSDIFK